MAEVQMTRGKVLAVGSNATRIEVQGGGTGQTGNYLNETVVPAMALIEAGYHLVLATPNGTKPHIDEVSDSVVNFGGDQAAYSGPVCQVQKSVFVKIQFPPFKCRLRVGRDA